MTVGTNSARGGASYRRMRRMRERAWSQTTVLARAAVAAVSTTAARRQPCPLLGQVGVPLAVMAALLVQPWCAACLLPCAWWWAPRRRGGEWAVAVGRGVVGAEWAWSSFGALATFPRERILVEGFWIALAVTFVWLSVALTRIR
jgi:hypothetical protein